MRPTFVSGTLELEKHVPYKEPQNTTEFTLQRRPMRLNEAPTPRSKNYELLRQIERQEMLKGLVTEKGLKIDSALNQKIFDVQVTDPTTGALVTKKVTLPEAVNLPITERIALLETAVANKDISAADRTALQAIVANTSRSLILESLSRDQIAAIQKLILKTGKPIDYKDATLDRFHDSSTMTAGKGIIELFLLSQARQDASGNPIDFVTDPSGTVHPIADIIKYLTNNPTQLLDLDSKTIILSTDAQTTAPADYNKWDASRQAIAASGVAPSGTSGTSGPAPGGGPPPPPPVAIPTFTEPDRVNDRDAFSAVMNTHHQYLDITWPDPNKEPNKSAREILTKFNSSSDSKKMSALRKDYKPFITMGEQNRMRELVKLTRPGEIPIASYPNLHTPP